MGDGRPDPAAGPEVGGVGGGGRAEPPQGARQTDPRVLARARRILLEPDDGADARNEHRRRRLDAVALQRLDVAHLVDVDREHHAERELPAPGRPVHARRQKHREQRAGLRQAEQEQLGLGEHEHERELELREQGAEGAEPRGALAPAGSRPRGSRGGSAVQRATQLLDARRHHLVLRGFGGEQIERLAPGSERGAPVARLHRLLRVRRQPLQFVGVDQPLAGRAGQQRGRDVGAALWANGRRLPRRLVDHAKPYAGALRAAT